MRRRHLPPVKNVAGDRAAAADVPPLDFIDVDDSIGVFERQPLQQYAVDDAEHRRVGADADGQRENDNGSKNRGLDQHPCGMPQVASESVHVHRDE